MRARIPGVAAALAVALVALAVHYALAGAELEVPWLTLCVVLGLVLGQFPKARDARLAPGLTFAGKSLMRAGIVLLGFAVSFADIARLGVPLILAIIGLLAITFCVTYAFAKLLRMPGKQPALMAAGFSICGASAIGAMAAARGADEKEQGVPAALVTLCGTAAIAALPLLRGPLGLDAHDYGVWVGASVHDVGQVVAAASVAGTSALAIAVVVKLVRVVCLAPMVAIAAATHRGGKRPALVPLFVAGFLVAAALRTWVPIDETALAAIDALKHLLLGTALVALLGRVRLAELVTQGWRGIVVAVGASVWIAGMALAMLALL